MTRTDPPAGPGRNRRWPWRAGALASVALVGATVFALTAHDRTSAGRPPTAVPEAPAFSQQMAGSCRTPTTVCPLPSALPIGAPCDCGGQPGSAAP